MKKITKLLAGICLSSTLVVSGCIEETFPTSGATEDQVVSSDQSASAMLWGMHAMLNTPAFAVGDEHTDWGYGSMMHIRDIQTADMPIALSGYDQYQPWEMNLYMGQDYLYGQIIWNFYWRCVLSANKLLGAFPLETASDEVKGYIGAAHAYRAMLYLDLARMYEYLPCDGTQATDAGNDVTGLTVPIVTEETTEEESYNNPRVPRAEMAEFILSDLQLAEENIVHLTESSRVLPHLDVVYGLFASYYMWLAEDANGNTDLEAYRNAQKYARMAIDESGLLPMSQEECLSTSKGFNTIDCWMWGCQMVKENDLVQTGVINWVSHKCNETTFGYAGAYGVQAMIETRMYNRIDDNDFRKRLWKAPKGSALDGKTEYTTSSYYGSFEGSVVTYGGVKFRPGEGNPDDVNLAASTAYPLMRVEEMYFIEAEAAEHVTPGAGKVLLEDFMNSYRIADDAPAGYKYTCTNADIVDEIVFQKRVELWGEGLTFFDVKRLDLPVNREGTNFKAQTNFSTTRRPAWMNYCIVQTEPNSNRALVGYNNPDPSF